MQDHLDFSTIWHNTLDSNTGRYWMDQDSKPKRNDRYLAKLKRVKGIVKKLSSKEFHWVDDKVKNIRRQLAVIQAEMANRNHQAQLYDQKKELKVQLEKLINLKKAIMHIIVFSISYNFNILLYNCRYNIMQLFKIQFTNWDRSHTRYVYT